MSKRISTSIIELDRLMTKPIPNFKVIEDELRKISPAAIAIEIEEDVGFAYLLDYYLKYMDVQLVKNILQNPTFTHKALLELFSCRVTAYHKAIILEKEKPELLGSYWSLLGKTEYAVLFKHIIQRSSDFEISKDLFSKIDLSYIKLMSMSGVIKSDKLLKFFKHLGKDITRLTINDPNVYDFAFQLAMNNSDFEFIDIMEEYTVLFVQLRIANNYVTEVKKSMKNLGRNLKYNEIIEICRTTPRDSLKIVLQLFEENGWISHSENISIDEYFSNK